MININSANIRCIIKSVIEVKNKNKKKKRTLLIKALNRPICMQDDDKISIIRKFDKEWRLVGLGQKK